MIISARTIYNFNPESVVLGTDADVDDVTSYVVSYTSKGDRPKKLSKTKQIVHDGLTEAIERSE